LATKEIRGDPFTGEFLVPDESRFAVDIAQHLVPYLYCAEHLGGMRVVEIGCGALATTRTAWPPPPPRCTHTTGTGTPSPGHGNATGRPT